MRPGGKKLLICGALGLVACAIGLLIDARTMLASYLVAWTAVSSISIGALGVIFTSYLVRAGWTQDIQEPLSRAALAMPLVALLFVPVLIGMHVLYPWTSGIALPPFKAAWFVPWLFVLRAIAYFAIWSALAVWAARASGDPAAMQRSASAGLIVWALTASLAGIDWSESVEPEFHSSIYGLLVLDFDLLGGLAFAMMVVLWRRAPRQMSNTAYAGVLLSTLLLWAYMHAMQYIIIWAGNIPDEVSWYLRRLDGGWAYALWALFIAQFVLPFFALLSERVRASTRALLWLAGATLALRYLEAAILILPPLKLGIAMLAVCIPAAILLTGAGWIAAWQVAAPLWRRSRRPAPAQ